MRQADPDNRRTVASLDLDWHAVILACLLGVFSRIGVWMGRINVWRTAQVALLVGTASATLVIFAASHGGSRESVQALLLGILGLLGVLFAIYIVVFRLSSSRRR